MTNTPHKVYNKRKNGVDLAKIKRFAVISAIVAAVLLITTVIIIFASGFSTFSRAQTDGNGNKIKIKFVGRRDKTGEILSGTLYYSNGARAAYSRVTDEDGASHVKLVYRDGGVYEGGVDGSFRYNGQGVLSYKNGELREGTFEGGFLISGELTTADGSVFSGSFVKGIPDGRLTVKYAGGDVFDGTFINGLREGRGVYTYADGGEYNGLFRGDLYDDENATLKIYVGMSGETERFDQYDGQFVGGVMDGLGTYKYASGEWYVGEFKNGTFNGAGTYYYSASDHYSGVFKDGKFVG